MEFNIFIIPEEEVKRIGFENAVYGYPLEKGLVQLADEIKAVLCEEECVRGIDLGCGDGAVVDYFNRFIGRCEWHGIELSAYRLNHSRFKENNILIEGNLLEVDLRSYDFIFCNNLAFDDKLKADLEKKVGREFTGHFVLSDPFTQNVGKLLRTFCVKTNWSTAHLFYLYKI
jgi:SAM-dependent methyltransferase